MWASAEAYALALERRVPLQLVADDGRCIDFDVTRWLDEPDAGDRSVLDRCVEPVLDVGSGPGRMVRSCYERGIAALGVDVAREAVALSNRRGGPALRIDVFDELPAEGRWATILLLDGNVGIGGDVSRLLGRVAGLLAEDGRVIAEATAGPIEAGLLDAERRMTVRLRVDGAAGSGVFPWSVVGPAGLQACAASVGLVVADRWRVAGRDFLMLARG